MDGIDVRVSQEPLPPLYREVELIYAEQLSASASDAFRRVRAGLVEEARDLGCTLVCNFRCEILPELEIEGGMRIGSNIRYTAFAYGTAAIQDNRSVKSSAN